MMLFGCLYQNSDIISQTAHEQIIVALTPLLENNHPTQEICSFFSKVSNELFSYVCQKLRNIACAFFISTYLASITSNATWLCGCVTMQNASVIKCISSLMEQHLSLLASDFACLEVRFNSYLNVRRCYRRMRNEGGICYVSFLAVACGWWTFH